MFDGKSERARRARKHERSVENKRDIIVNVWSAYLCKKKAMGGKDSFVSTALQVQRSVCTIKEQLQ